MDELIKEMMEHPGYSKRASNNKETTVGKNTTNGNIQLKQYQQKILPIKKKINKSKF